MMGVKLPYKSDESEGKAHGFTQKASACVVKHKTKKMCLLWEVDAGAHLKTSATLTFIPELLTLGGQMLDMYFRMGWIAFVKWLSPLAVKIAHGNEFRYKCGDKLCNNSSLHSHCKTFAYKMVNHQLRINFEGIKWRTVVGQSEYKSEWCPGSVVMALAVKCRVFCFLNLYFRCKNHHLL